MHIDVEVGPPVFNLDCNLIWAWAHVGPRWLSWRWTCIIIRNYWWLCHLRSWEGAEWIISPNHPLFLFFAALPPYFHFFHECAKCLGHYAYFNRTTPGSIFFGDSPHVFVCLSTEVAVFRCILCWDEYSNSPTKPRWSNSKARYPAYTHLSRVNHHVCPVRLN